MKRVIIFILLWTAAIMCSPAHAATDALVDSFEGATWNANWSGTWIRATDQIQSGTYSAKANGSNDGMLISKDINTASATSITVDFWFRKDDTDTGGDLLLYYYDGGTYTQIVDLDTLGSDDTWLHYTQTITDSRYFKSNFRIQFEARALSVLGSSMIENVWIDNLRVSIETGSQQTDADRDGYPSTTDCNDNNAAIHPGATETCGDNIDQDCSGADLACSGTCQQFSATNDAHVSAGRATTQTSTSGCETVTTYYAAGSNESMGTAGTTSTTLYTKDGGATYHIGTCSTGTDVDGDGYPSTTDCNDNSAAIHPGATEVCGDSIDQDCSGADSACTGTCQQFSATNDAHVSAGRATTQSSTSGCETVTTYYAKGSNENMGTSGTTSTTLYTQDGGTAYRIGTCSTSTDADSDGYPSTNDCNDTNANIHPGATETCGDGIDQDCSGADLSCGGTDADGDGYPSTNDCNDNNASIHPNAFDFCGDSIDQDCEGGDTACLPAPSCISNLSNWKIKYAPTNANCASCHTTCTPGGSSSRHSCTVGGTWMSSSCTGCHSGVH